ncbi:Putative oligoketide cyclase/dehydratase or lipid transport protein YfjG [invertebrate metagenome]|uniref:Oligoketide cyclase/dehydratase or lipid transport protein YfjG n=1 Tax=invertebrate metagenome TaxID=1711999 RepID=A0A484H4M2_9ZZZZ
MSIHSVERLLPYTSNQLFDLVADVERYPEFVPWWVAANVWKKHDNVYYTRQVLGLPFLRQEFQSRTTLNRPQHINISSVDRPFKKLDMNWYFRPSSEEGTCVHLQVDLEWCATRYAFLGSFISEEGIIHLVDTFEDRATQLFGKQAFMARDLHIQVPITVARGRTLRSPVQHPPIRLTRAAVRTRSCAST